MIKGNIELKALLIWSGKRGFVPLLYFLAKKIIARVFRKPFGRAYYPDDIELELQNALNTLHSNKLGGNIYNGLLACPPAFIPLASMDMKIENDKIDWEKRFKDPEDTESLHRWNWLLQVHAMGPSGWVWCLHQLESWIDFVENSIEKSNISEIWESYTVGERLSNFSIFILLRKLKPSERLTDNLIEQAKYLAGAIEYRGHWTGNHVVNNARALYLIGAMMRVASWQQLSKKVLERELPRLVTPDGFLREGSSHYQLLFSRWLIEIDLFARKIKDIELHRKLSCYLSKLLAASCFFMVHEKGINQWHLPLFGDISPDFPPDWLMRVPFWQMKEENLTQTGYSRLNDWLSLWGKTKRSDEIGVDTDQVFSESGWYRHQYKDFILIYRLDKLSFPNYAGHHHIDQGHFVLFFNGEPVFVDSGRLNYMKKDSQSFSGISADGHNSLTVNGLGPVPNDAYRYPYSYAQSSNSVSLRKNLSELTVDFYLGGFARRNNKIRVKRTLTLKNKELKVKDTVQGKSPIHLGQFYHFSNHVSIEKKKTSIFFAKGRKFQAEIKIESLEKSTIQLHYGGESPLGWQVTSYGRKAPAPTIFVGTCSEGFSLTNQLRINFHRKSQRS